MVVNNNNDNNNNIYCFHINPVPYQSTLSLLSHGSNIKPTAVSHSYRKKEGNVTFNDALNTFYLWLYGVIHMV